MKEKEQNQNFVPRGAIAFFAIMICFYIMLWMVFYFILLGRQ